ncbi:MAG: hypothetical protein V1775_05880, partial [Bacteroidota bacterium]
MKKSILLLVIFAGILSHSKAQWTQGTGMYGGDIRCLAKVGTDLYAGSQYGGIFRSSDNGNLWNNISSGLPGGVAIKNILEKDNFLFAGTSYWSLQGDGVYRSDDNGATWVQKNTGIQINGSFNDLNISGLAKTNSYIFASTVSEGIYRSANNGEEWTRVFDPFSPDSLFRQIHSLCNAGEVLFAGGSTGLQEGGIFRSIDQGSTWELFSTGFPSGVVIYQLIASASDIYARTSHGFYWSPSNGEYWIGINNGITQPNGAATGAISAEGATVFASTFEGSEGPKTYKSTNRGSTWSAISTLSGYYVQALLSSGNSVYAGNIGNHGISSNGGGIIGSNDGGLTWVSSSNGISALNVMAIDANQNGVYAGSRFYSGIYKTVDNGINWTKSLLPGTTSNSAVLSMLCNGNNVFAGVNSSGVYISNDNGQNWIATANIGYPVYAMGANPTYIFAGTSNQGMRRSSNNGTTWTTINTGLPTIGERTIRSIAVFGSKVYIGTSRGIFTSTNDGTNWVAANGGSGSPGYTLVRAIAVMGDTILAGTANGIIRTFNKGTSWTLVSSNINIGTTNALCIDASIIYAGGQGGVFSSNDWGETWTSMNETFPSVSEIYALKVQNGRLYAGTYGQSLWYIDLEAPVIRTLNLSTLLEGLYNGSNRMREANGEAGPQFGVGISDEITVELHNAADYGTIEHTFNNVPLDIYGNTTITVPAELTGDYYISINHRNSIETVSAAPVSFAGSTIIYTFDAPEKAYGGNLLQMTDGTYVIYGGDVTQDGSVDTGDLTPVDNDQFNFVSGYFPTDVNGDGTVDTGDLTIID